VTHQHTIINGGGPGTYNVSSSRSAAAHLGQDIVGAATTLQKKSLKQPLKGSGQTIKQIC
jgi:hypothetical protein